MPVHTHKQFITNRHGLKIAVLVEIPDNPQGLAFIVHGFKSSKDSVAQTSRAHAVLEQNYVSARFDCTHACGDSDGDPTYGTITNFIEDLTDVIAWAGTQDWYRSPFVLIGTSLGGIAALEYTRHNRENVLAIAPLCTILSGTLSIQQHETVNPGSIEAWKKSGFVTRQCSCKTSNTIQVPWSHMEDRLKYDALAYADTMTCPLFMHVGSLDELCPPEHQKMLFDRWGSQDKEFHVLDGAPHALRDPAHLKHQETALSAWLGRMKGLDT